MKGKLLGEEKIGKLLLKMSAPAVVGMIVNSLYNVIDTIFIARGVGTEGIGGLAIAFPVQIMIFAFGLFLGTGAASVVSRYLGEGRQEEASRCTGNVLFYSGLTGLLIAVPSLLFLNPVLKALGATDTLLPYASEYLQVILIGAPLMTFTMAGNNIVRAEGKARIAMVSMILGTGLNIILDPIFIFDSLDLGFVTLPALGMGIQGAALATVLAQSASFFYMFSYFFRGKSSLKVTRKHLKIDWVIFKETLALGVPSFIRQAGGSFVAILINNLLGFYGSDLAISTFGIVNRLLMFGLMPIFGVAQGFQPIAGFNYGAKNMDRVFSVLRLSMIVTTVLSSLFFLLMYFFPHWMFSLFKPEAEVMELGQYVVRIIFIFVPLVGVQMIGSTFFLAIGRVVPSFFLGLSRQIIFLLPLLIILPRIYGLDGIWYAFPAADILAVLVTSVWLLLEVKKLKKHPERIVDLKLAAAE